MRNPVNLSRLTALSSRITTFEPKGSGARRGHTVELNEWPKMGSEEEATNDRMWVSRKRMVPYASAEIRHAEMSKFLPVRSYQAAHAPTDTLT